MKNIFFALIIFTAFCFPAVADSSWGGSDDQTLSEVLTEGDSASASLKIDDLYVDDDLFVGDDFRMTSGGIFKICPTCTNGGFDFHTDANFLYASGPLSFGSGTPTRPGLTINKTYSGNGISVVKTSGTGDGISVSNSANQLGYGLFATTNAPARAGVYARNTAGGNALQMSVEGGTGDMMRGTLSQTSGELIKFYSGIGVLVPLTFEMLHNGAIGIGHDVTTDANYMLTASGTVSGAIWIRNNNGANGPVSTWYLDSDSPAAADENVTLNFNANNITDGGGTSEMIVGQINLVWDDPVLGRESSTMVFEVANGAAASTAALEITGGNLAATGTALITVHYPLLIDTESATPTCAVGLAGTLYFNDAGGANDKDLCSVCAKANGGAYDWRQLY